MTYKTINITAIRIGGGTQSRAALDQDVVAEYAASLSDGVELPPIVTFFDGTDHWLADGFHRYFAYRKCDFAAIPADVRDGTQRDAILFSCGANAVHGLRRSNADKRKAVSTLLADEEWAKWSDSAIAKVCSVSDKTVAAHRLHLRNSEDDSGKRTVERGGKTFEQDTSNIGRGKLGPPEQPAAPDAPEPATQTAKPKPSTDDTGAKPALTEAEQNAEDAYDSGETDLQAIARLEKELAEVRELLEVCEADDMKAEALKWRKLYDNAVREQSLAQDRAYRSEQREKHNKAQLMKCGKEVGEDDPDKIAAAVRMFVKREKASVPCL